VPYGGAQVIIQLIDFDEGDDSYYGDYMQMNEFLQTRLLSFKVNDRDKGKDRLELTFRNDDYQMIESPVFAKGQKLLVTWGWPGEMVVPRRFIVQSVKGSDNVVVSCHCRLSLMDREKKTRFEENVTHSEFVRKVVEEYGYSGTFQWIEDTTVRADVTQANTTDARFINRLAKRNGFVFYEDATGIHFHKRNLQAEPVRWFVHRQDAGRGDILSAPRFDINLSRGVAKVKVTYRDPVTKEYGVVEAGPDSTEIDSLGEETEIGNADDSGQGLRASRMTRVDTRYGGIMTKEEAQVEANARYFETASGRYKMETEIIGDARVGAKLIVGFAGISDSLDGLYYISEAEHNVAGGKWTISLKCRKDALNRVKVAKPGKRGAKAKVNPEVVRLEDTVIIGEVPQLKKQIALTTDSQGNIVPAYYFTDGEFTSGMLTEMTPDEIASLNDKTLKDLYDSGCSSAEPDAAM
jgi:phage protein D